MDLDGTAVAASPSQRPWALFAYLALAGRLVTRSELVTMFWPDVLDRSARASLRSALWALRRQLGDALVVDGERVGLGGIWVDVREFERLAADDPHAALELCRGELLEGVEDDWASSARERHRQRVIELLERLAMQADERGDGRAALELTRRQVDRDPFDEEAHRRLIARLAAAGDRAAALQTYRSLGERLRRELGVAPSPVTRELVDSLRGEAPAVGERVRTMPAAGLISLVGRERELRELERAWQTVRGGAGAAASIRGEAGIGKTRLATELRLRVLASGGQAAASAALDLGGVAPLSLWAELIRELLPSLPAPAANATWPDDLGLLVGELPAHFERGAPSSSPVAPELQRTRLFEAVVAMIDWGARQAPLLLVLDDVHSADAPSLELAAYAARRVSALPVMLLITRRRQPVSVAADGLEQALRGRGLLACELELGPLADAPVAALARAAARLSARDVSAVVRRAEGNALLAVETARALARGQGELAASLRASARGALASLAPDVRRLIEIAAVAARPLEAPELRQLDVQDPDEAAGGALETGLMVAADGGIAFRHALLREAVYAEIAEPRRRGLHHRWALALLASEEAGAVARPAEVARQLRLAQADREAVPQLVRAAVAARELAALEEAVAYLEEALAIESSRADLWLELGELEAWRLRREQAERAFEQALVLLEGDEPLVRAQAWLRRARAYHGPICVPRAVLDSARNALELIDLADTTAQEERSEALAAWAWAEAVAGSVEQAERLLAELGGQQRALDDLRIYDVGHARALVLMRRGRFTDSYAPSIAAGEAIARAGRPDLSYGCWANCASAATAACEHDRALEFLDRGMAALSGQGLRSLEIHLLGARSFVLRTAGRLEQARAAVEAEQALAERLGRPELLAMARHDSGMVALEAGQYELAAELLAESLAEAAQAPISRPLTRLALAEGLARSGRPHEAAEQVRETVLEPVRPSDFPESLVPRLARIQGLIALGLGDRDGAARRLEESIAGWERLLARTVRADSITTVLADLGRPVVGLVEPERELKRARADLELIGEGGLHAVVP